MVVSRIRAYTRGDDVAKCPRNAQSIVQQAPRGGDVFSKLFSFFHSNSSFVWVWNEVHFFAGRTRWVVPVRALVSGCVSTVQVMHGSHLGRRWRWRQSCAVSSCEKWSTIIRYTWERRGYPFVMSLWENEPAMTSGNWWPVVPKQRLVIGRSVSGVRACCCRSSPDSPSR